MEGEGKEISLDVSDARMEALSKEAEKLESQNAEMLKKLKESTDLVNYLESEIGEIEDVLEAFAQEQADVDAKIKAMDTNNQ